MTCGVEDDLRAVFFKNHSHRLLVCNVGYDRDDRYRVASVVQRFEQQVYRLLSVAERYQFLRLARKHLAAYLGTYRAAGPGNHDSLALYDSGDVFIVELYRVAAQQIFEVDRAQAADAYVTVGKGEEALKLLQSLESGMSEESRLELLPLVADAAEMAGKKDVAADAYGRLGKAYPGEDGSFYRARAAELGKK